MRTTLLSGLLAGRTSVAVSPETLLPRLALDRSAAEENKRRESYYFYNNDRSTLKCMVSDAPGPPKERQRGNWGIDQPAR